MISRFVRLYTSFTWLVLSGLLVSCTQPKPVQYYPTLSNKGMLPLSTNTGSVGANLFLAKELERSSYLFKFFQAHGAPAAIEINSDDYYGTKVLMFYPRSQSVYVGDQTEQAGSRQWIIRGPYGISKKDWRNLQELKMSFLGEPVFDIYGKPYRFRFMEGSKQVYAHSHVEPHVPSIKPPKKETTPAPTPTPTPKEPTLHYGVAPPPSPQPDHQENQHHEPAKTPEPVKPELPDPKKFTPLNTDQQAILMSQGYAERATNGDIVHTVKSEQETIEAIVTWYTGSEQNTIKVARYNSLAPDAPLSKGQRVKVPLEMIERVKQMPEL